MCFDLIFFIRNKLTALYTLTQHLMMMNTCIAQSLHAIAACSVRCQFLFFVDSIDEQFARQLLVTFTGHVVDFFFFNVEGRFFDLLCFIAHLFGEDRGGKGVLVLSA